SYCGFTNEVSEVWKNHHAAIFTSRGGEGLPRALLEASSCGRPSIVTDVSGCNDFIRDGVEGYVVPIDSEADLKRAILNLMSDRENLVWLGQNARERVLATSTARKIQSQYEEIFAARGDQSF